MKVDLLVEALMCLEDFVNYSGGADCACHDEYVMNRAKNLLQRINEDKPAA